MKDPGRSSSSSGFKGSDVILNNQMNSEENPFAEYMWMENEEEFNRQVDYSSTAHIIIFSGGFSPK